MRPFLYSKQRNRADLDFRWPAVHQMDSSSWISSWTAFWIFNGSLPLRTAPSVSKVLADHSSAAHEILKNHWIFSTVSQYQSFVLIQHVHNQNNSTINREKWVFNPYWQIMENSSRNFSEIFIFRVVTQAVLLENSSIRIFRLKPYMICNNWSGWVPK